MQQLHAPTSSTAERSAPRPDISTAITAEPTANKVSEAASNQPCGWNAYSLIMSRSGSRSEVTCSAVMAPAPPARAAYPPAVKRLVMPLTVASGLPRGHRRSAGASPGASRRRPRPHPAAPGLRIRVGTGPAARVRTRLAAVTTLTPDLLRDDRRLRGLPGASGRHAPCSPVLGGPITRSAGPRTRRCPPRQPAPARARRRASSGSRRARARSRRGPPGISSRCRRSAGRSAPCRRRAPRG